MAKVLPYYTFDNVLEAVKYYNEVFGDILIDRVPMSKDVAEGMKFQGDIENATLHAVLNFDGGLLFCSDNFSHDELFPQTTMIDFNLDDEKATERAKEIAAKMEAHPDWKTGMALSKQFWGGMFGDYTDKFGNKWLIHVQSFKDQQEKGGPIGEYYNK